MVRLVCFDFDGVIAQTEGQHTKWLMEDLDKAGVTYTKEKLCTIMGGNMLVHVKLMDEAFGDQDNYRKNREEINRRKYRKYDLKALKSPYVTELMEKLQENNIKICVCSNSEKARVINCLEELELTSYVTGVYGGTDCGHTKPDPFIYIQAMKDNNISPEDTIVIEDSTAGIKAGVASGAYVIAYKDAYDIADQHEANVIVNDFIEAEKYIFSK